MGEPKMESKSMEFAEEELKNSADEQKDDPVYNQSRSEVQVEKQALEISGESGEEALKKELETYQLAKAFDETETAERSLNNMRTMLQEGREKLEGGEWAEIKKEIFKEIMQGQEFRLLEKGDQIRFRVAINGLKEKFGTPISIKDDMDTSELFGLGAGEFTRIANTQYVAYVFKYNDSRMLIVKKWSDEHLERLENLRKNREEVN